MGIRGNDRARFRLQYSNRPWDETTYRNGYCIRDYATVKREDGKVIFEMYEDHITIEKGKHTDVIRTFTIDATNVTPKLFSSKNLEDFEKLVDAFLEAQKEARLLERLPQSSAERRLLLNAVDAKNDQFPAQKLGVIYPALILLILQASQAPA